MITQYHISIYTIMIWPKEGKIISVVNAKNNQTDFA